MGQCKIAELHPPFLPKSVTRYRHEYFLPIKRNYHLKLTSSNLKEFQEGIKMLSSFVVHFDCELFEGYL